jgi:hypothetical protein
MYLCMYIHQHWCGKIWYSSACMYVCMHVCMHLCYVSIRQHTSYVDVCWGMLTYADVCWAKIQERRSLSCDCIRLHTSYADVCWAKIQERRSLSCDCLLSREVWCVVFSLPLRLRERKEMWCTRDAMLRNCDWFCCSLRHTQMRVSICTFVLTLLALQERKYKYWHICF